MTQDKLASIRLKVIAPDKLLIDDQVQEVSLPGLDGYQRLIVKVGISGRPLLLLSILLIVIGVQFITLGLLAEVMVRTYHESLNKKIYSIREIIDSDSDETSE